jgi:hypothetical protein
MIPVYSHRYLPAEPCEAGNPVLSIYQTDIIHYGYDLADYFAREFRVDAAVAPERYIWTPPWAATEPRPIRFWDDVMNGTWHDPATEPSAPPVEMYAPQRIAEFLLSNAVTMEDYAEARREVEGLGIDPDTVDHVRP